MKYKVLIIDDEFPIRKSLNKIISQRVSDCTVVAEAENGRDGIEKINEHNPDIIITDIFMPQTDGLDMLEKAQRNTKVIVITGFRDFDKMRQAVHLNVFDILVKPIDYQKLIDSIQRAVNEIKSEKLNSLKVLFTAAVADCDIVAITNYADSIINEFRQININDIGFLREYFSKLFFKMQETRDIIIDGNNEYEDAQKALKGMIEQITDIDDLIDVFKLCVDNILKNMKQTNLNNITRHIQAAIDYINENYKKKLSLDDIAQHINLSVVHTSRLFKRQTGKTILEYINEVKLNKAKQMLNTGNYKVYEVSDELGFSNAHYFSTLFKNFTGVTPSEYLQNKHLNN